MKVTIFVEGGGNHNDLKTRCRKGFKGFFERAGFRGQMPNVIACGSRGEAIDKFRTAISKAVPDEFPILLVDSERPVRPENYGRPWAHLASPPDNWQRPPGATDDHAHLMVQCMESWFLADRDWLVRFFGQGFAVGSLPGSVEVEGVPKQRVFDSLASSSRACRTKGSYGKGKHSFELLAGLDPNKVEAASLHAKRLFDQLRSAIDS